MMPARRTGLGLWFVPLLFAACQDGTPPPEALPEAIDGRLRLTEEQSRAAAIVTTTGAPRTLSQVIRVPGSVGSPDTAQIVLGSIVEGRVVRVQVVAGDRVRRGQRLVEIHTHELADAQAQLTASAAEAAFEAEALQRAEKLYEAGAIALQELQRRRTDDESARAELARAEEMVAHLYPTPGGNSAIVAPRAGMVFSVEARTGQAVVPGTPMVEMGSTDVLWVTAFVPENASSALAPGDSVAVEFRSSPGAAAVGRLVRSGAIVDPANRSVEMRFELQSIPQGVRGGSFATVAINVERAFEGLELAEEAAVRMGSEDVVFVEDAPRVYRAVAVQVTSLSPGRVAVQGVPDGARVVVEGAYFLKSAMDALEATEGGPEE